MFMTLFYLSLSGAKLQIYFISLARIKKKVKKGGTYMIHVHGRFTGTDSLKVILNYLSTDVLSEYSSRHFTYPVSQ